MAKKKDTPQASAGDDGEQAARHNAETPQAQRTAEVAYLGMKVDPEVAVREINQRFRSGMQAIGDYLVEAFFAGDIANVHAEGRNSPGFARLRQYNEQLELGYSSLCQILSAQKQRHELQLGGHGELIDQLKFTHQTRLLSVNGLAKIKLLKQAVKHGWTVRQLDAAIAEQRPTPKSQPLTPKRVQARLERIAQEVQRVDTSVIQAASKLPAQQRRKLRTQVDKQLKALQKLRDSLDGQA